MDKDILKLLECPRCSIPIRPPIYICYNGHSVCNRCKPNMGKCIFGNCKILNTRNQVLENVAESLIYPCTHKYCDFLGLPKQQEDHAKTCKFAPRKCLVDPKCKWSDSDGLVCDHVKQNHPANMLESASGKFVFDEMQNCGLILVCHNTTFSLIVRIDSNEFKVLVGPLQQRDESKFEYCLMFHDQEHAEKVMHVKRSDNINGGIVLQIALNAIELAKVRTDCYRVMLRIMPYKC